MRGAVKAKGFALIFVVAVVAALAIGATAQAIEGTNAEQDSYDAAQSTHANHDGWTALTAAYVDTLASDASGCGRVLPSGQYYLTDDLKLDTGNRRLYIHEGASVEVCLNGYTAKVAFIKDGTSDLTICSCKEGGEIGHVGRDAIEAYDGGILTLQNITVKEVNNSQGIDVKDCNLLIIGCTIEGCTSSYQDGYGLSVSRSASVTIEDTSFENNLRGIYSVGSKITFKNSTIKNNSKHDVLLYESTLTLCGDTSVGLVSLREDAKIALAQDYQNNKVKVQLTEDVDAPYVVSDTYSTCFVCTQLPYHIANKDGASVLEYRINQQPSADNNYEFILDKNGESTSEELTDANSSYQWYEVANTSLDKCTYRTVNYEDIDSEEELNTFAQNAESGVVYVVGSVSGASISSNSEYQSVYPQMLLLCKNDAAAPKSVLFSSTASKIYDLIQWKVIEGQAEFSEHPSNAQLQACWMAAEQLGTFTINNVSFERLTTLTEETTAKLTNPQGGKSYKCVATLGDGFELVSETVSIPASGDKTDGGAVPKTGDNASLLLGMAVFSMAAACTALTLRRRHN